MTFLTGAFAKLKRGRMWKATQLRYDGGFQPF